MCVREREREREKETERLRLHLQLHINNFKYDSHGVYCSRIIKQSPMHCLIPTNTRFKLSKSEIQTLEFAEVGTMSSNDG